MGVSMNEAPMQMPIDYNLDLGAPQNGPLDLFKPSSYGQVKAEEA